MTRRGRKIDAKGRNPGGTARYVQINRNLIHSPQFSALCLTSRALLVELHGMFNGTNNGSIFLSCKDAAARLGLADLKAVRSAFDELRDLGFLTETVGASFSLKAAGVSKARAWNLNWIVRGYCAGPDVIPSLDFTALTKSQKRRVAMRSSVLQRYLRAYQQGKFAVEESATLMARKALAHQSVGAESNTAIPRIGENQPFSTGEDSSHYIKYHGVRGFGWWTSDRYLKANRAILSLWEMPHLKAAA